MSDRPPDALPAGDDTVLTHAGNRPRDNFGVVNPPVYHASTILFPTVEALREAQASASRFSMVTYGRQGTPTTIAFEETVARLEGADRALALPSGLAAIAASLMAFLKTGDHLLMVDTVYGPVRTLCKRLLTDFGIATSFYDPAVGDRIEGLMRPETKVVYLEAPGSLTFEMQDVPAVAAAARARGATTIMDNTWATPLFFKPLKHGVDVVIEAATKYIGGHSDLMMGVVAADHERLIRIKTAAHMMGHAAAPDDCYLALRGLRTLSVRLERHQRTGLALARWLQARPEVERVLHPALPQDPGHRLWQRDFAGATGLFGIVLKPCAPAALESMLDGMELFGMGYSWGGYESLILPVDPKAIRSATRWETAGPTLRLHAGLEDPKDLIADLDRGFARLNAGGGVQEP
ncbi:cystathionine beta-lyase [Hypericibacter adhaerens]|uniref:Cystathionine beta-lyase n=1 Tax=Hypericibacter adhaerens TaxID=2602016 RepID=A0A5J6MXJ8_9PROT|nr:cystathionine beta-lyase [Hypericibacter adhaerens]QEX22462.1 cystathionine beta-lyase [Hypericibacter adhaerens]